MNVSDLIAGNTYRTVEGVDVCYYDALDCVMPDMINLPAESELTYIGPDADDGYVFMNSEGTKYCLHDNDLVSIKEM